MIINIEPGTFGGLCKNGDMIGIANVIEYLRKIKNDPTIKFHMLPGTINTEQYSVDFFDYLKTLTDYFSDERGPESLSWRRVNLWDFRDISGDLVKIKNDLTPTKKIVIFPLFDAPYNHWRNWPSKVYEELLKQFSLPLYDNYDKIVCSKNITQFSEMEKSLGWSISTDLKENLDHIRTSEIFIGGDTGTSHFAWSLDRSPKELIYVTSSRGLIHTMPFYLIEGKGVTKKYWLDMESTVWN